MVWLRLNPPTQPPTRGQGFSYLVIFWLKQKTKWLTCLNNASNESIFAPRAITLRLCFLKLRWTLAFHPCLPVVLWRAWPLSFAKKKTRRWIPIICGLKPKRFVSLKKDRRWAMVCLARVSGVNNGGDSCLVGNVTLSVYQIQGMPWARHTRRPNQYPPRVETRDAATAPRGCPYDPIQNMEINLEIYYEWKYKI